MKVLFNQYEVIRKLGICNMFDVTCVKDVAYDIGFIELSTCARKEYTSLLRRYDELKNKYSKNTK